MVPSGRRAEFEVYDEREEESEEEEEEEEDGNEPSVVGGAMRPHVILNRSPGFTILALKQPGRRCGGAPQDRRRRGP